MNDQKIMKYLVCPREIEIKTNIQHSSCVYLVIFLLLLFEITKYKQFENKCFKTKIHDIVI